MIYPRPRAYRLNLATSAVVFFSLLLAGCFTSAQPKLPLATAVAAFGDGGRYAGYSRKSDGNYEREETFTMRRRAGGGYDYVDEKGKVTPLSLHRIGPDLYVVQAIREDGRSADYVALRVAGNEAMTYAFDCAKQDAGRMKALGVDIQDNGRVCVIDAVADPAALFATLDLGEPTGKMVRE